MRMVAIENELEWRIWRDEYSKMYRLSFLFLLNYPSIESFQAERKNWEQRRGNILWEYYENSWVSTAVSNEQD